MIKLKGNIISLSIQIFLLNNIIDKMLNLWPSKLPFSRTQFMEIWRFNLYDFGFARENEIASTMCYLDKEGEMEQ